MQRCVGNVPVRLIAALALIGFGVGCQPANAQVTIGTVGTVGGGFVRPVALAVSDAGDLYVIDNNAGVGQVKKVPAGCTSAACVGAINYAEQTSPEGLAYDNHGNALVIADGPGRQVMRVPRGCGTPACVTTIGGGFKTPAAVAVDPKGNVFVADSEDNAVKMIPPGCASAACVTNIGGGFKAPSAIAADGRGNVYIKEAGRFGIKVMAHGCMNADCVDARDNSRVASLAVDGSDNLYFGDTHGFEISKVPFGCTDDACVSTVARFGYPIAIAVDKNGNLYVADDDAHTVKKLSNVAKIGN